MKFLETIRKLLIQKPAPPQPELPRLFPLGRISQLLRMRALLAGVTYKPGCRFVFMDTSVASWADSSAGDCLVRLQLQVTDVNGEHAPGTVCVVSTDRLYHAADLARMSDRQVLEQLIDLAIQAERHEIDEWLKYQGKCVTDPHPNLVPAPEKKMEAEKKGERTARGLEVLKEEIAAEWREW